MNYDHKKIEKKWQEYWAKHKIYSTPDSAPGKENFYLLVEFPYPSGNLHVGHWYAFAVPDILSRFKRMQGHNVLYPIGFDAFGLPAENAAIKNKLNPRDWTEKNIAHMTKQIESMGTSFDWSRKVSTIDPTYYKWTQALFLEFYKKGLVYQKETAVNWCPKDKTVLANEQVVDGKCERCGTEVIQKQMLQWNIKITEYADRLIDDLAELDWPEQIKESQRNWIGRSEGAEIDFYLDFGNEAINARVDAEGKRAHITVFTTRPDTLFGATYLVLAPEHLWVTLALGHKTVLKNNDEVAAYVKAASKKTELERQQDTKEKTGVKLEGVEAVNPATGEKIPLYVADYVLAHYGTGAIMAVPAHDERDYAFAKKFDVPIKQVVARVAHAESGGDAVRADAEWKERDAVMSIIKHWEKDEYLCISWKNHEMRTFPSGGIENGESAEEAAKREVLEETGYQHVVIDGQLGGLNYVEFYHQIKKTNVRARFRYFVGHLTDDARIDISSAESAMHEVVWVPKEDLEKFLLLKEKARILDMLTGREGGVHTGDGYLVNSGEFDGMAVEEAKKTMAEKYGRVKKTYRLRDWIVSRQRYWGVPIPIVHCEQCGAQPVPEKELPVELPEVKDYLPDGRGKSPLAKVKDFVQTECPKCGGKAQRETDTLDTFVDSSWYFLRYADPRNNKAFASKAKLAKWLPVDLYSGGAEHTTMHLLYSRFWHKALYDLELVADKEPYKRRMNRSIILGPDGQKMSKSHGNVIDPDEVVERLGADTVRLYLAFIGPYSEVSAFPWNPDGVVGVRRFLERVWRLSEKVDKESKDSLTPIFHKAIKKVGEDIPAQKYNTAISQMMILLNEIEKQASVSKAQWEVFLLLLAPFAPHMAEELWSQLGHPGRAGKTSIHKEQWPEYEEKMLQDETVTYAIQINGKTRGEVSASADADKDAVEAAAREAVAARLEGKEVSRVIVVPKRLVNFVVSE